MIGHILKNQRVRQDHKGVFVKWWLKDTIIYKYDKVRLEGL